MTSPPAHITSRDNPLLKDLRRLAQESTAWRRQGRIWLEGDHLCRAAVERGVVPAVAVFAEGFGPHAGIPWARTAQKTLTTTDALFAGISGLESPAKMGFVVELPQEPVLEPLAATVILDRLQDAGNVGSILRSAAAFGFRQVLALKGTAALWSPKVLRAGMGAHFGLKLIEGVEPASLDRLAVPILVTSSHQGEPVNRQKLPKPCAWALGHEGQGVGDEVAARASLAVRIEQPGGEESLNVAAAAAICLYASSVQ
ncbi:MAG: RNA methyltransferase [Burkholderiaceae bacterium]